VGRAPREFFFVSVLNLSAIWQDIVDVCYLLDSIMHLFPILLTDGAKPTVLVNVILIESNAGKLAYRM